LSHPNVLKLVGVPDTLEGGMFSMVSEWMTNGNIVEYVSNNAGNHLKLVGHSPIFICHLPSPSQLADAVEGLRHLHRANIAHGDLKGVSFPCQRSKNTSQVI
jgi:serine/threonine protein kinase